MFVSSWENLRVEHILVHRNVGHSEDKRMGGGDNHLRTPRGEAKEDTGGQNVEQQGCRKKIPIHLSVHQESLRRLLGPKEIIEYMLQLVI